MGLEEVHLSNLLAGQAGGNDTTASNNRADDEGKEDHQHDEVHDSVSEDTTLSKLRLLQ